ncbi:MAG: CAP domain-containing protein [Flavobacteriaceae bacterium]|nr:CAP domain-containing protein [Flavobacteriaceae bacterium]
MKKVICILFLLCTIIVSAQLKISEKEKLGVALAKRINELRVEKGRKPLERDIALYKAAEFHSGYMAKFKRLTHIEHIEEFRSPRDRVDAFSDEFETVGENILQSKPVKLPLTDAQINKLAFDLFRAWRGSEGHHKNMISSKYTMGELGFDYDPKTRRIYVTQVFGKKGAVVPNQLSDDAFGIIQGYEVCDEMRRYYNVAINMGNTLGITAKGEVYLAYHDKYDIQEIFKGPNDGLAVDLIDREQLSCEGNQLDKSPIYDGVMLKPVYKEELLSNNIAEGDYRLITKLGHVPEHLKGRDLQANLIFIINGEKCSYSMPSEVDHKAYDLRKIEPSLYNPNIPLLTEGIHEIREVYFDFDTGETIPLKDPELNYDITKVSAIDINSFTSVEGSFTSNERLHNGRADYIKKIVTKGVTSDAIITTVAKENWELCEFQLELYGTQELIGNSQQEIRSYFNKNAKNFKDQLQKQRRSKAVIFLKGTWSETSEMHYDYNLLTAIINNDIPRINRCLAQMYQNGDPSVMLRYDVIFERLLQEPELVENISAFLLKYFDEYSLDSIVFYVRNWLNKPEKLSEGAQKNLLNLYAITTERLLDTWDVQSSTLAKVMDPERVDTLMANYKGTDTVHPLLLNFHIATIKYYGQINASPKIRVSFNFIRDYFKTKVSKIDDEVDLALFFNSWSRFRLTNSFLLSRFNNKDFNERAAFLLAQTISVDHGDDEEMVGKVHRKAFGFNKKRWCDWVNEYHQLLRDPSINDLYCSSCNQ